jgi:hypothetical protein
LARRCVSSCSSSTCQSGAKAGADFCSISGLERPGYSQKVERVYGEVAFLGTILLEEEQFASS